MVVFFVIPYLRIDGQAAHPARPAAPRVHALRHHVPADGHAALHAAARSASLIAHLPAHGAVRARVVRLGAARRRCTWSSCSGPIERLARGRPQRLAGARPRARGGSPAPRCQVRASTSCWRCSSRTRSWPTSSASTQLVALGAPLAGRAPDRRSSSWLGTTALILFDFALVPRADLPRRLPVRPAAVGAARPPVADRRLRRARAASRAAHGVRTARRRAATASTAALCVLTCPTGIDIRDGLQMECIHCTQCVDACDASWRKVGKPPGLIRYSSRDALEAASASTRLRPARRALPGARWRSRSACSSCSLARRADSDVTLLRGLGAPFTVEADGRVANQVRVKITNRKDARAALHASRGRRRPGGALIAPDQSAARRRRADAETSVFVLAAARRVPATASGDVLAARDRRRRPRARRPLPRWSVRTGGRPHEERTPVAARRSPACSR